MGGRPKPLTNSTDHISMVLVSGNAGPWHIRVSFRLHRRLQPPTGNNSPHFVADRPRTKGLEVTKSPTPVSHNLLLPSPIGATFDEGHGMHDRTPPSEPRSNPCSDGVPIVVDRFIFVPVPQASCHGRISELSRQRDERGVFRAHTPYPPDSVPVTRLTLPSLVPAFLEPGTGPWDEAYVLPSLWRIASSPGGWKPRLWGRLDSPIHEIQALLDKLAACLYHRASNRWQELEGRPVPMEPLGDAFRLPLADARDPWMPACMWPNPVLVDRATGIRQHTLGGKMRSGYTTLDMCEVHPGKHVVREFAHRFVHWAMRGPPRYPLTWATAVVIHLCENASCLNPMHMRWGTQEENLEQARRRGDSEDLMAALGGPGGGP